MLNLKIKNLLLALLIFIFSASVWYLPLFYKGYAPNPVDSSMIIARNLHFSGKYAVENDKGEFLSTARVKNEGITNITGNQLTPLVYAKIYDLVGYFPQAPQYITISLYALANALVFLLFANLFGLTIGLIFSGATVFMPVIWEGALMPGFYEWAFFYFAIGFIFYFLKNRSSLLFLLLSGTFFSLAILSRNAFIISVGVFGLFELLDKKSIKRLVIFGLPMLIIVVLPFIISYTSRQSVYLDYKSSRAYGHCFPDPYTFLFAKEDYMNLVGPVAQGDVLECFSSYGYAKSFKGTIYNYLLSIKYYIRELFRLITFGGPLVWFLAVLGVFELNKRYKPMLKLFAGWLATLFIFLVILKTSNWDHLLEIWIPVVLLVSFGVYSLARILMDNLNFLKSRNYIFLSLGVAGLLLVGHLVESNKWMFHEEYNTSRSDEAITIINLVGKANLSPDDIIALDNPQMPLINYQTDKTLIKFDQETIKSLLAEEKLGWAFSQFGVTKVVGYDYDLMQEIEGQLGMGFIIKNE